MTIALALSNVRKHFSRGDQTIAIRHINSYNCSRSTH